MNKIDQFYHSTNEDKQKLIKAENPTADDTQVKEHVETLDKFFEEMLHGYRATPEPTLMKTILIATQDTGLTHGQLEAIRSHKPVAFGIYSDDVSEDAKEVMNGIVRDVLRKLEKTEE